MIFEIICQKPGLGYLLFKYFLDSKQSLLIQSNSSYLPEPDLFLAISMLIVMMIVIINNLRNIIQHYLIEYRR